VLLRRASSGKIRARRSALSLSLSFSLHVSQQSSSFSPLLVDELASLVTPRLSSPGRYSEREDHPATGFFRRNCAAGKPERLSSSGAYVDRIIAGHLHVTRVRGSRGRPGSGEPRLPQPSPENQSSPIGAVGETRGGWRIKTDASTLASIPRAILFHVPVEERAPPIAQS